MNRPVRAVSERITPLNTLSSIAFCSCSGVPCPGTPWRRLAGLGGAQHGNARHGEGRASLRVSPAKHFKTSWSHDHSKAEGKAVLGWARQGWLRRADGPARRFKGRTGVSLVRQISKSARGKAQTGMVGCDMVELAGTGQARVVQGQGTDEVNNFVRQSFLKVPAPGNGMVGSGALGHALARSAKAGRGKATQGTDEANDFVRQFFQSLHGLTANEGCIRCLARQCMARQGGPRRGTAKQGLSGAG